MFGHDKGLYHRAIYLAALANMRSSEGAYVDGKRHGHWVMRGSDGDIVAEESFVDGKQLGHWVWPFADEFVGEYHTEHGPWWRERSSERARRAGWRRRKRPSHRFRKFFGRSIDPAGVAASAWQPSGPSIAFPSTRSAGIFKQPSSPKTAISATGC